MATLYDLPRGVAPETGTLIASGEFTGPNATVVYDPIRFDIGPGFAVGIDGIGTLIPSIANSDGHVRAGIVLDPDQTTTALTTLLTTPSAIPVLGYHSSLTTSGAMLIPEFAERRWNTPIWTVRNAQWWAQSSVNHSAESVFWKVYYRIYSVSDEFFVRTAGISLSRG